MILSDLAIATSEDLPNLDPDCALLLPALRDLGIDAEVCVWDDPAVRWDEYRAVLIRSTWDYTRKFRAFTHWVKNVERYHPLWNPSSVVLENCDKSYLRGLAARGLPTVPTVWLAPGGVFDLEALKHELEAEEIVVKPTVSAGAAHTWRLADAEDPACGRALEELGQRAMMAQPYLGSVENVGETSLLFFGGEFSHAVCKVPRPGDFRVQEKWGATVEAVTPSARELELAARALEGPDLLYARVDFVYDRHASPLIIEVELIEPALYLRFDPLAAGRLARCIEQWLAPLPPILHAGP